MVRPPVTPRLGRAVALAATAVLVGLTGLAGSAATAVAAASRSNASAAVTAAATAATSTAATSTAVTSTAATASTATTPVDDLGACMASRRRGSVLILLDQSGSLRDTDPGDTRVPAARYLVQRLAALADRGIAVRVSVGGFAGGATTSPFQQLGGAGTGAVLDRVTQVGSVDNGFETDYWSALETASTALRSEQRTQTTDGVAPCSALLLFTDGQYDLGVRSTDSQRTNYGLTKPYAPGVELTSKSRTADAVRLGEASICRAGGVVDQLRSSDVRLFALGLGSPNSSTDFSTLQRIATGRSSDGACGKVAEPAGDFRPASDVDALLFGFDALGDPTNPALAPVETGVCQRSVCPRSHASFQLDGSIRRIHLLGTADLDDYTAYLTSPSGGAPTALTRQDSPLEFRRGAVTGRVTWLSDRTFALDATIPADGSGWTGQWSLAFVDPTGTHPDAVARTQLTIYGDLAPALAGGTQPALRLGERQQLDWVVQRTDGSPVDPRQLPRHTSLDVDLVRDGSGATTLARGLTPSSGRFTTPVTVDPSGGVTGARLRVTLHVTTNGGTRLADTVRESPVTLTPPASYPSVATALDFPTTDGTAPVTSGVDVRGPGCVWLDSAQTTVTGQPDGITGTTVSSPHTDHASCLALLDGQEATLPVTLAVTGRGAGASTEQLTVLGVPTAGTRTARYVVAAQAPVIRSVDAGRRLGALIAALALGLAIPLLLWFAVRFRGARFRIGHLQWADVTVSVDAGGKVTRSAGGALLSIGDLVPADVPGQRMRTMIVGSASFRARMGRSPIRAGTGRVTVPGELVGSVQGSRVDRRGGAGVPLALREAWFLHAPAAAWADPEQTTASLLVVVSGEDIGRCLDMVAKDVARQGPPVVAALRAAAAAQSSRPVPADGAAGPAPDAGSGVGTTGGPPVPMRFPGSGVTSAGVGSGVGSQPSGAPPIPARSPAPPVPTRSAAPPLPTRPGTATPPAPGVAPAPGSGGSRPPIPTRVPR